MSKEFCDYPQFIGSIEKILDKSRVRVYKEIMLRLHKTIFLKSVGERKITDEVCVKNNLPTPLSVGVGFLL